MNKIDLNDINLILSYINQKNFFKLYSRNASVQIAENFAHHSIVELEKILQVSFSQLIVSSNEFVDAYSRKEEFVSIERKIRRRIERAHSIKDFFEDKALPIFKKYINFTSKINLEYANKHKNCDELLKDFKNFSQINAAFVAPLWYIFLTDLVFDKMLKERLHAFLKEKGRETELQKYLILVSVPLKRTAVVLEHEELLKLALKSRSKKYGKLLEGHTQKWRWFPCYNPSDDPYTIKHYKNELKSYTFLLAKKALAELRIERKNHAREYKFFLNSLNDPLLKKLVSLVNMICFYREYRNDLRREGLYNIRPLYEAIGKQFGLNAKETCHLTNEEIVKSLEMGKLLVPKNIISNRLTNYVIFFNGERMMLIDDKKDWEKIDNAIKSKENQGDVLKGSPAFGGLVRVKAFVITNIDKLKNFRQGDILVASMTAPDYVSAMKKAAAIITDEGGITCHAAIVSRELKIPCIVGTKIATKVFKDGDLVEVDATRGIVKKLKKITMLS